MSPYLRTVQASKYSRSFFRPLAASQQEGEAVALLRQWLMRQSQDHLTIAAAVVWRSRVIQSPCECIVLQSTFAFSGSQDIPHSRESARASAKRSAAQLLSYCMQMWRVPRHTWIPWIGLHSQHSSAQFPNAVNSAFDHSLIVASRPTP